MQNRYNKIQVERKDDWIIVSGKWDHLIIEKNLSKMEDYYFRGTTKIKKENYSYWTEGIYLLNNGPYLIKEHLYYLV